MVLHPYRHTGSHGALGNEGPQVIINDHPEMPNRELASTHFRQSHDAQYGTRVDALSEFMYDHSMMTKWPASCSNIRIQRWGAKKWIHDIADTLFIDGRGNYTPTDEQAHGVRTSRTPMQERGCNARTRKCVCDRTGLATPGPLQKERSSSRDAAHQESQVGPAGTHYFRLTQACHPPVGRSCGHNLAKESRMWKEIA